MKIELWPLGSGVVTKDIEYGGKRTEFCLNIKFQAQDKTYRITQQFIDISDQDEVLNDEEAYPVSYEGVSFSVDAVDLSRVEITNALVNFLAHYKLYLHHFSITKQETRISYASPESESAKIFDLAYQPAYRNDSIFIDVEVQLEDDVDYYELLNIKTKELAKSISGKKLKELGYAINDYGIYNFAIIDEENAKEYLK